MTPERMEKFRRVAAFRQMDLTVVLENVHDPHNIGAVLRSCDSVGIPEIYVLYTEERLSEKNIIAGKSAASGARKWVDIHYFTELDTCVEALRKKYRRLLCTHLGESAVDLYELNLTHSTALVFGNEHEGVSKELLARCDGNFVIPQVGMVQSLNISVACAVTLYEAFRQRWQSGKYNAQRENPELYKTYLSRHAKKA